MYCAHSDCTSHVLLSLQYKLTCVSFENSYFRQRKDVDLAMQFWWRASALESLRGYIQGVLLQKKIHNWRIQLEKIVVMLSPLVDAFSQVVNFQDPAQASGGPGSWVAGTVGYLQLRLLEVYSLIPSRVGYPKDHEALVKLCSKPIRGPAAILSSSGTYDATQIPIVVSVSRAEVRIHIS